MSKKICAECGMSCDDTISFNPMLEVPLYFCSAQCLTDWLDWEGTLPIEEDDTKSKQKD